MKMEKIRLTNIVFKNGENTYNFVYIKRIHGKIRKKKI